MEGNLRFKIDWASLILGRKFTVFLCFTSYLRAISKYKPPKGGLYLEGRFNRGFFALRVWGAFTWRGLFSEFYGMLPHLLTRWLERRPIPKISSTLIRFQSHLLSFFNIHLSAFVSLTMYFPIF